MNISSSHMAPSFVSLMETKLWTYEYTFSHKFLLTFIFLYLCAILIAENITFVCSLPFLLLSL